MGRPQAPAWRRRMRTTFDYGVNFRMTTDDSNPIVPYSNHVGLSVESVVFDTFYGNIFKDKSRYEKTTYADIQDSVKKHSFVSVQLQAHHYSNGQDGDAEYVDPLGTRNNYRTGNFSTNYWRLRFAHSTVNLKKHSLFTAALGFRKDGSVGSVLNYDENQRMAYGYYRIEYLFDWYSAVHETRDFFTNRLDKWQHHLRINGDFIADKDLSNFTPNLTSKENNKFRLGVNALVEIRPLSYRTIGYLVRAYVGRDYLNIRYDDIIFTIQTGLTLTLDKYYPSGWYPEGDNLKIKKLPPRKMFRRVKS
jgi:hypothetical protein